VPGGVNAFADQVVSLSPGDYRTETGCQPNNQGGSGSAALGPPDDPAQDGSILATEASTSVGYGGSIVLHFNTPITASGTSAPDIWVWETGTAAEPYHVDVSSDGVNWVRVGTSNQATFGAQGFDIDDDGFTQAARLFYVRITDFGDGPGITEQCNPDANNSNISGSDIDAVAGLSNPTPAVELTKTASPVADLDPGDVVTYSFLVQNTGSDDLNNIAVTDPKPGLSAISCPSATLAPLTSMTCTATYTVTLAEVLAGPTITNTATVQATGQFSGRPVNDTDDETVRVRQQTDLSVTKQAGEAVFALGQPASYTIVISNTGLVAGQFDVVNATFVDNVPADLTNVTWQCFATPGSNCDSASGSGNAINTTYDILEGGNVVYRITGILSTSSTATTITNTATVALPPTTPNGVPMVEINPNNNTSTATTPVEQPAISLDKVADYTGPLHAGDTVPYRFVVTNTGSIPLSNVTISDPLPGLSAMFPASVALLAPGASTTFIATYVITQADVDRGEITNIATVTGYTPSGEPITDEDTVTLTGQPEPNIAIAKTSNVLPGTVLRAGNAVTYTFTVTNTGNITLENVTVEDPLPGLSAITPVSVASLAPGASTTFTATYIVTQADVDAGQIANTASTTGETPDECTDCPPVPEPTATHVVDIPQTPAINIVKSSTPAGNVQEGDTITYTFDVTNTGNVTLTNVTVSDPLPGLSAISPASVASLEPNQHAIFTATYVVTAGDVQAGLVHNVATTTGNPPASCTGCTPPTDTDEHDVPVSGEPGLSLVKSNNVPPGQTVGLGDVITYTFTAQNTGSVPLTNVTVTDQLPGLVWQVGPNLGNLIPGQVAIGTATYVVTQADVDRGFVHNSATAGAQCGQNCTVPPTPPSETDVPTDPADPDITLDKSSDPAGGVTEGDTITYTFTATNTGNVTLTDVRVTDPLPGLSAISPSSVLTLAPGESTTFTATYTVTANDVARGFVHNTATVTGTPPASCSGCTPPTDTDDNDVPTEGEPGILLDKDADVDSDAALGQTITYSFTVYNTGDVNLENVVVTDPLAGLSAISCPQTTLNVGQSMQCTATYVVKQADITRGRIDNTATVTGDPVNGDEPVTDQDDKNIPTKRPVPGIDLVKSADTQGPVSVGDTITYTFSVTNTGEADLANVTITDALPNLTWVTGPNVGALAVGATKTGTATYVVTQADVDNGVVHNAAIATGTPVNCPDCPNPTDGDDHDVPTDEPNPALELTKTADTAGPVELGDTVTYTFTVTNTGNVTIDNATVSDALAGLTWVTGPNVGTLAPGQSATGTATYVVTEADILAGNIHNVATATGDPRCEGEGCDPVTTPPAEEDVPTTDPDPAIEIVKDADTAGPAGLGETITYTFAVTNTGNVTLSNATITDPLPGLTWVTGPNVGTLAPGETKTGTATYVVTEADVDAGNVHNIATATGTPPEDCVTCTPPTDEDDHDVPTDELNPAFTLTKAADTEGPVTLGDTITYTFTVTNTGNVTIENVTVTDALAGLTWVTGPNLGTIAPGERATGTATYVVTEADVLAGNVHNAATATGDPTCEGEGCDPITTPPAEEDVPTVDPNPAIEIVKSADTQGPVGLGDTITYTFTVTNTGNVTLTDATITDTLPGLTWVTGPNVGDLAPGESATGTATYVVTQADVDAGTVHNVATVTGTPPEDCVDCTPPTDEDDHDVPTDEDENPAIDIVKDADTDGPVSVGDTITYTFTVTNTGNVALSDVTITDTLAGLTWVTGPNVGDLAPGESATGTATYVVTQADVDAGNVHNAATVTGDPQCEGDCTPPTDSDDEDVPTEVDENPAIDLDKAADTTGPVQAGDTITYTFTVTNTGDVTLDNVTITDGLAGLTWVTGPNLGTLAPGESATGTATYVVTGADVQAGSVHNAATVTGDPQCQGECTPPTDGDETDVPTGQTDVPGIQLQKNSNTDGPVNAGDVVTYIFTVTNTGNVTLTNITIDDPKIGTVFCANALAPGESTICTAPYTVTQADVDTGQVYNVATVIGTTPGGGTVTDDDDDTVTTNPCAPAANAPLDERTMGLSVRALIQQDPSTPVLEPTQEPTLEPTETVTEEPTLEPTETATETVTAEPTETATATSEPSVDAATPGTTPESCETPVPPTPTPIPTQPGNPGNPGGPGGNPGGGIPPVTNLPSTGNSGAVATDNDHTPLLFAMLGLITLFLGSYALRRYATRDRADH
jgi:uncharacterized repeat protein (TIGR01451 family)